METPYGVRRVTYADYTASGRALTFVEDFIRDQVLPGYANTHTESSGTGLQTTRLREEAREIIRERGRWRRRLRGDLHRIRVHRRDREADRGPRAAGVLGARRRPRTDRAHPAGRAPGRVPRPLRAPLQRDPVAGVDRRRRGDPSGHRRGSGPRGAAHPAGEVRRPAAEDRHVLRRLQRDRHPLRHRRDLDAPARARRAQLLGLRGRGAVHRHRDGRRGPGRRRWPTRTPSSCRRTSSSVDRPPRACWWPDASCSPTGCRTCPAAAPCSTSTTTTTATSTTPPTARRAARPRSSSRSGRAWSSSSRRRSAPPRSASRRSGSSPAPIAAWREEPAIELLGNLEAPRLSIVSFVVRSPSGRYLHHNYVVALLNDLFGIQSRGGCSCAGPYGHRLLGIDIERSHEFEREIAGGCEGIKPGLGPGQLQLLRLRRGRRLPRGGGATGGARGLAAARRLLLRHRHRAVAASRRCGHPAAEPARHLLRRRGAVDAGAPRHRGRGAARRSPDAGPPASWRPRPSPISPPTPATSARTSSTCAGSTFRRGRWGPSPSCRLSLPTTAAVRARTRPCPARRPRRRGSCRRAAGAESWSR